MNDSQRVFLSQQELYRALLPVFRVKKRINQYYGYDVTYDDMWKYLGNWKWKNDKNLTLAEIVNDIIILDVVNMKRKMINNE